MKEIAVNPEFKAIIPPLTEQEYKQLEQNILTNGCLNPIITWRDTIIDGHNRYAICHKHDIDFDIKKIKYIIESEAAAKIWIVKNQFGRRNINAYQRSVLALQLEEYYQAKAKTKQQAGGVEKVPQTSAKAIETRQELAKEAGVSHDTITKVKKINQQATAEQKEALTEGNSSINEIYKNITGQEKKIMRHESIITDCLDNKKHAVLYCDPPWQYEHVVSHSRAIEKQYPTMQLEDIKNYPIHKITANNCILFLWTTSPKLAESIEVINQWNFNYRTCMVWVKDKIGMGYYVRQKHELLLIAKIGEPPMPEPEDRIASVVIAPRLEHSKKPQVFYEIIEKMYPDLPKAEVFAREEREGWTSYGNEIK
ncbi:MAG: hypothetical protein GY853_13615 [PVC group bacterium]|nr:hypothetical protein [PVC group bacterium]